MFSKWIIREFAEQINRDIFGNMLELENLKIKQNEKDKRIAAWCIDETLIRLNPEIVNTTHELFITLGHELIHVYQHSLDLPPNHGTKMFRYYAEKFVNTYDENFNDFMGIP